MKGHVVATVGPRRSKPNPAFDWCADVPEGFDISFESDAPMSGIRRVPIHIWWSGERSDFDMGEEDTRVFVYEQVLHQGRGIDVLEWIQPRELVRLWDKMFATAQMNDVWDPWIRAQW